MIGSAPYTPKISASRLTKRRLICLIGGIRWDSRSGTMAAGKRLKAAILARRAAKGPRKKRTRPEPRQYTVAALRARLSLSRQFLDVLDDSALTHQHLTVSG